MTPVESMPAYLQVVMSAVPSTHYVKYSQAVLFRGASLDVVWPQLAWMTGLGLIYLAVALGRFRRMLASSNG
jgi:ABC-2 type transport system permease protein